jgi:hypothetical protein
MREIRDKIDSMGIEGINQVRCGMESIDIVSSVPMTPEQKSLISSTSDNFAFRFIVEGIKNIEEIVHPKSPLLPKRRKNTLY